MGMKSDLTGRPDKGNGRAKISSTVRANLREFTSGAMLHDRALHEGRCAPAAQQLSNCAHPNESRDEAVPRAVAASRYRKSHSRRRETSDGLALRRG